MPDSPALVSTVQAEGLLSRDATLVVLAFAVWSFLSGVSLLVPGDVFLLRPYCRAPARLDVPEASWGAMMALDAEVLSVIGCREVVAGLALLTTPVQWAGCAGGPHGH